MAAPMKYMAGLLSLRSCFNSRSLSLLNTRRFSISRETKKQQEGLKIEKRVFSGIQPTGIPHIGNYFGAIRHWVEMQNSHGNIILSIVDLHSITVPQNPAQLRQNIHDMVACLLACGVDPDKTILFQQSSVCQHAELAWVLGCLCSMPRLQQLPQWKEKSHGQKEVGLGLFTYPILQAADILLYKATDVPVGDDQVKHIELARDLASSFNSKFGELFPKPKAIVGEFKRIKSLRKPENKMSKSASGPKSRIEMTDAPDAIREKLKKAKTDFTPEVTYDPKNRPGVSNLVEIYAAFTDLYPEEICEQNLHLDTLGFKMLVADVVIEHMEPIHNEFVRLQKDKAHIESVLKSGQEKAQAIASETYQQAKSLVGLV